MFQNRLVTNRQAISFKKALESQYKATVVNSPHNPIDLLSTNLKNSLANAAKNETFVNSVIADLRQAKKLTRDTIMGNEFHDNNIIERINTVLDSSFLYTNLTDQDKQNLLKLYANYIKSDSFTPTQHSFDNLNFYLSKQIPARKLYIITQTSTGFQGLPQGRFIPANSLFLLKTQYGYYSYSRGIQSNPSCQALNEMKALFPPVEPPFRIMKKRL